MIMQLIYRGIILFFMIFIIRNMYKEKKVWEMAIGGMVLIPFVLRFLLLK